MVDRPEVSLGPPARFDWRVERIADSAGHRLSGGSGASCWGYNQSNLVRRGDDLYVPVEVPVTTAALGGEVAVRALSGSGRLALRIPAGTQNGRVFRLAGQGMPRFKREGRGDILAEVQLRMPDPLTAEQTDLFRRLRDLEGGRESTAG